MSKEKNVYLSHPTGNQNSRQLALALAAEGSLVEFATALSIPQWLADLGFLPASLRHELARRSFSTEGQMRSLAATAEFARLVQARLSRPTSRSPVDNLYRTVDERAAVRVLKLKPSHVYAYEDGALDSFRAAAAVGARSVYELPIGHWKAHRTLCAEEAERLPEWASTWALEAEPADKLQRKDEELLAADNIVVPSEFVHATLTAAGIAPSKISIVPYGCPAPVVELSLQPSRTGRLRVLFVGGLSQRKGLSYLIDALAPLDSHVEMTVIGRGAGRSKLPAAWRVVDSLPHDRVLEEMRQHDVFVFPTLFEGRSLALAEAAACGLILITTPNSGAADLVESGLNGWLMPIRDAAAITEKLEFLLAQPGSIADMRHHSLTVARRHSWAGYASTMNRLFESEFKT